MSWVEKNEKLTIGGDDYSGLESTYLVTNLLLSFFFSFLTHQKQKASFQQVGGLVTRNISVFC